MPPERNDETDEFGQSALAQGVTSIDDDPEQAARAMKLSQYTGVPSLAIYGDMEGFEQRDRQELTSHFIRNNPILQDYINSHPMAAKVSNDDWHKLDEASAATTKLNLPSKMDALKRATGLAGAVRGFKEGYGEEPFGSSLEATPADLEYQKTNPITYSLLNDLKHVVGEPIELMSRVFGGAMGAIGGMAEETYKNLGLDSSDAERLGRDVRGMAEQHFMGLTGTKMHMPEGEAPALRAKVKPSPEDLTAAITAAKPYIDAGIEPPVGLHPLIDKAKTQQAKVDIKNLDEALQTSSASATRERSPELYAGFVRQHTDAEIGISAEAVRKLYGDARPTAEDGKLGWIPNLEQQLSSAEAVGGDVKVPLADWLAKVEPELAKELHDDIRVRRGGLTLNEAEELGEHKYDEIEKPKEGEEAIESEPATPIEAVRQQAKLDPLFSEEIAPGTKMGRISKEEVEAAANDQDVFQKEQPPTYKGALATQKLRQFVDTDTEIRDFNSWKKVAEEEGHLVTDRPNAVRAARVHSENGKTTILIQSNGHRTLFHNGQKVLSEAYEEGAKGFKPEAEEGEWIQYGKNTEAFVPKEFSKYEDALSKIVDEELQRIVPNQVQPLKAGNIRHTKGGMAGGVYTQFRSKLPEILYALREDDPIGTARHEAIHHLRAYGFFTDGEWATLEKTAKDENWIYKNRGNGSVADRYKYLKDDPEALLEESIADEYRYWAQDPAAEHIASPIFEKLRKFLNAIKERVQKLITANPEVEDIFNRIHIGEVGAREGTGPRNASAFQPKFEELGEPDKKLFDKASAIDMTTDQYKRYLKLIDKRNAEDQQAQMKKATELETRKQSKEWKDIAAKIREEVAPDIRNRPDIAASDFLDKHKLDESKLTAEQKKALPDGAYGRGGVDPDLIAGHFGYLSTEDMVAKLGQLKESMGEMNKSSYIRKVIDQEVTRRMEREYGKLDENIIKEAQEHVLSQTQMDLLHEETVALGMQAGSEMPFSKADIQSWVDEQFNKSKVSTADVDSYLANAGKAGRAVEDALLKNDPTEAFRQRQRQYLAAMLAKQSQKLEKELGQFDKKAKRFAKTVVSSVEQEYTDFIHDILWRVGKPIQRSLQNLAEAKEMSGHKDLESFVDSKIGMMHEMPIAEFLFDSNYRKQIDEMSVEEFREVKKSIDTLEHNGKEVRQVEINGAKQDLAETLDKMLEQLETLGTKEYRIDKKPSKALNTIKHYWASSLTAETILNRIDRGDPRGLFNQSIIRPMYDGAYHKTQLERKYSNMLKEIADPKDLDKVVENKTWKDPLTGEYMRMSRRNLLGILQNVGNRSNLEKLAGGYGLTPEEVMNWVHKHATKEDWDRAQKIGDIFKSLVEEADRMGSNISGVPIEKIPIEPIQSAHGKYDGWYHPIKYDPYRPGTSKKLMGPNALQQEEYFRATTPSGYRKQRTGYIAPIELNLDIVPVRMMQMIQDIAMRPAVLNASKVLYDSRFQRAMIKHYGKEGTDQLIPWLKDSANFSNFNSASAAVADSAINHFKTNLIGTMVGMNPHTVSKHGLTALVNSANQVGTVNFLKAAASVFGQSDFDTAKRNVTFAMENIDELQRRNRNWSDTIHGQHEQALGKQGWRERMLQMGTSPIAFFDLMSAIPTGLAQFEKSMKEGVDRGQALFEASRAVRQAHGSSIIVNRPAIMRSNGLGQTMTALYGFFSHMLQKHYEFAWKAKEAYKLGSGGDLQGAIGEIPRLVSHFIAYAVIPAVIEEAVTPYTNSEKESWGKKAAKTMVLGFSSSLIGVRDFVNGFINVRDPQAGVIGSFFKSISDVGKDLGRSGHISPDQAGRAIKNAFVLTGTLTGLANSQMGKSSEYIYRWMHGMEHPRNWIWAQDHIVPGGPDTVLGGITRGTARRRRGE